MKRTQAIDSVSRRLAGPDCPEVYVAQIGRVAGRLVRPEELAEIRKPAQLASVFHTAKLIPPSLLELCQKVLESTGRPQPAALSLAVSFAAGIFPRRAFQLGPDKLASRLELFLEVYQRLSPAGPAESAEVVAGMADRLSEIPAAQVSESLSDLSAVEQDRPAEDERELRRSGAALYLTSCPPPQIGLTYSLWSEEAGFVRYLRQVVRPPSWLARQDQRSRWPDWDWVRRSLAEILPGPPDYSARAVLLEQAVWNEAARWIDRNRVVEKALEFWEQNLDKLNSGFPYYAFLSHFPYWWKQCLTRFHFNPAIDLVDGPGDVEDRPEKKRPTELDAQTLRCLREGYRLVRTTFFARPGQEKTDAAERNQRLRDAVDQVWLRLLMDRIQSEIPALSLKTIQADLGASVSADNLNNISHRLRLRLAAYTLARMERLQNCQIRSSRRQGKAGPETAPLAEEPGVETIASVARLAHPRRTLLWAFTAHALLHPMVEPQRPDPWSFRRYLRELWHWAIDPGFEEALRYGASQGCRPDVLALELMQQSPWLELLTELRGKQEDEVDAYLDGADLSAASEAARVLLEKVAGDGLRAWSAESLRKWARIAARHWIVPVWYLLFVERREPADVPGLVAADPDQAAAVRNLAENMARARVRNDETVGARTPLVWGKR